jgi:hypothetical protein
MTPEVQIGDWVRFAGSAVAYVVHQHDLLEWRRHKGRFVEMFGTRDGAPWHWTRETGESA